MYARLYAILYMAVLTTGLIAQIPALPQPMPIPIVLHGTSTKASEMDPTIQLIRKHVGEQVYIKNITPVGPVANLYDQAEHIRKEVETDEQLREGFNVICFDQGGLAVRYYIERYNNPPVMNYISYGTPHQGVFGTPGTLDDHFKWLDNLEEKAYQVLYSWSFQKYIAFASYWHDTVHYDKYLKKASFLPYLNNEIDHEYASLFKYNICKLTNMVLVMSRYEQQIEPAISCHFGFYKKGSKTEIEEICATNLYQQDSIGLKTLHESGRLHTRFALCPHENFPEDEKNFMENALPFLLPSDTQVTVDAVENAQA